jgi:hypothetical protein
VETNAARRLKGTMMETRVEQTKAAARAALKELDKALEAANKVETEIRELTGRIASERQTRLSAAADAVIAGKPSQQQAPAADSEQRLKELEDVRPFLKAKVTAAADAARPFIRDYMGAVQSMIHADEARLVNVMQARILKDAMLLGAVLGDHAAHDTFGTGLSHLSRRVGEGIRQRANRGPRGSLSSQGSGLFIQDREMNSLPPELLRDCVARTDAVWARTRETVAAVEAGAAVTEVEVAALKP